MIISPFNQTICAPATSTGTGAVSIVRVSGPDALAVADKVVRLRKGSVSEAPGYSVRYGTVYDGGEALDEVLVLVFRAPLSYTGEDSVEISCHASSYIVQRIMFLLIEAGARAAEPGEFTKRAFVNGKMDLAQSEAVADLIASGSKAAHRIALNQLRGGYSEELQKMRSKLLEITSLMELELDFSEEDVEFADRSELKSLTEEACALISSLASTFRLGNAIKNGVPVAIVGAVNSGKSTLLNALVGEDRAIVSDIAGTTRDTVEETVTLGSTLFRFIDTAGIRDASETIEKLGIERTFKKISQADIVLAVLDLSLPSEQIKADANDILARTDLTSQKLIFVGNKADVKGVNKNVKDIYNLVLSFDNKGVNPSFVEISALTGLGLPELKELLEKTQANRIDSSASVLVSNARHYQELKAAENDLREVRRGLDTSLSTELIAQDLRSALAHLGAITGEFTTDEILGNIFQHFCIGK
ncbi:MAG: tRNA uridine-5-carboxymethylaminomethyl(34) synthesis GTPase MnmE [Bacteroidales bacterium]|nr:tRNA uridine-5-carboxymethylaminomethyl(34) synthesis GTPase MnmE [Bacteroidales bacterium]MBP5795651.1 tRNA uridine-5-carboxymethylaminomethyl(34) synthesis GTPase MnmE [Bacteroidales bacterium]